MVVNCSWLIVQPLRWAVSILCCLRQEAADTEVVLLLCLLWDETAQTDVCGQTCVWLLVYRNNRDQT